MELKEFIKTALTDIVTAVKETQEYHSQRISEYGKPLIAMNASFA